MRHDMFKVIVERPRIGGYGETKGRRKEHNKRDALRVYQDEELYDEPSSWEKIRPVGRGADRKAFNENLEPLWRYLQTQVGRCWDDVYSDIRENLSPRNTVQMHVVQHLKWQVRENVYLGEDGRVCERPRYARYGMPDPCLEDPTPYKYGFYVHPVTREFCVSPTKSKRTKKEPPTKFQVSELSQFRMINGEWYAVDFEKIPRGMGTKTSNIYPGKLYDPVLFELILNYENVKDFLFPEGLPNYKREQEYGFVNIRPVVCRPIGKREFRKLQKFMEGQLAEVIL